MFKEIAKICWNGNLLGLDSKLTVMIDYKATSSKNRIEILCYKNYNLLQKSPCKHHLYKVTHRGVNQFIHHLHPKVDIQTAFHFTKFQKHQRRKGTMCGLFWCGYVWLGSLSDLGFSLVSKKIKKTNLR